jgi:hypothetical protein
MNCVLQEQYHEIFLVYRPINIRICAPIYPPTSLGNLNARANVSGVSRFAMRSSSLRKRNRAGSITGDALVSSTGSERYSFRSDEFHDITYIQPEPNCLAEPKKLIGTVTPTYTPSRGRTGTTRARTSNAKNDELYIVTLIENKAKEVGVAAYNLRSFDVELRQYGDTNCFANTMTILTLFRSVSKTYDSKLSISAMECVKL